MPRSKLAEDAREERLAAEREMTPEQRLLAFVNHCQLMAELHRAGERARQISSKKLSTPAVRSNPRKRRKRSSKS
jgi:hypothetical protein